MSPVVKFSTRTLGKACVVAMLAVMLAPLYGQAQQGIPRAASGRPNLSGIWQALSNAHWDIEPHQASAAMDLVPGPLIPVPAPEIVALGALGAVPPSMGIVEGYVIPYLPAALEIRNQNRENSLERDPAIKCYLPGVPRATYMPFPFQIFQSESAFFITYEFAGADRNVYLQDPGPAQVDSWMGQSVGHWEGDTFVVYVAGFTGQAWLDRAGNHHSYQMTVEERYTMIDRDHIMYEATMTDPNTFSRPWTISLPLYRHIEDNARIGVFKCVEFVEELLYGQYRKGREAN